MENKSNNDYLLIIDGSSLLSTQFYGNLPREIVFAKTVEEKESYYNRIMQTKDGIYTNAVYGFMRVLLKILRDQAPTHIAIAWDVGRNTFRREMCSDYKANRSETLAPLKQQFILCQEVLKAMNIVQFMDEHYEADDFSGTLAKRFEKELPVRIMTKDNDYLQLISEQTNIWMIHGTSKKTEELYQKYNLNQKKMNVPDRTFPFNVELLKAEFMIEPESVTSLKALWGDASDNIKGVKGVGEVTAQVLISHYKTIEKLYDEIRNLDDTGKKKINEFWKTELGLKRSPINHLLKESDTEIVGEKAAILSKMLATIKTDIDLNNLGLDNLKLNLNSIGAKQEFKRLEFKSLMLTDDVWQEAVNNPFEEMNLFEETNPFKELNPLKDLNPFDENNTFDNIINSDEEALFNDNSLNKVDITDNKTANNNQDIKNSTSDLYSNVNNLDYQNKDKKCQNKADNYKNIVESSKINLSNIEYKTINSILELKNVINEVIEDKKTNKIGLSSHFSFSFFTECDIIYGIGLTISQNKIYYISLLNGITEIDFVDEIKKLVEHEIILTCYQLKKVLPYIMNIFVENKAVLAMPNDNAALLCFDVELAAYLINPIKGNYPLLEICSDYLDDFVPKKDDILNGIPAASAVLMYPEAVALAVVYESSLIYNLKQILIDKLNRYDMLSLYYEIEMPLVFTLYDIEHHGIKADKNKLEEYGTMLKEGIKKLEISIYELAEEEFNINSPKQLGVVLFDKMKLPNGKKTKTGYSTSADVLEKIEDKHPIISKILEYRQLSKLKSTYADGLAVFIKTDGRIHSTFNQTITATGRLSSTEPNLQNIPIRLELGRQIRKVFTPEEGYIFIDADYSQIELRILAHMSGDEELITAYNEAQDIHKITASRVFHVPLDMVTNEQRSNAKAVNFGIVYGISSFGLGQGLNISRHEAEEYISKYFETYKRVKEFLDELIENGRTNGYVTTIFNRHRPVEGLNDKNYQVRSASERIAMNTPIQGTAADIIKIAMNNINRRLKSEKLKSRLILQVHDELLVEALIEERDTVKKIMQEEMQEAVKLRVKLEIDIKEGTNWYEAK